MNARVWQKRRDSGAVPFTEDEKHAIEGAKIWLNLARTREEEREGYIEYMREGLEYAKITIKYFNLSENEITRLLIEGHRHAALMWLDLARKRTMNSDMYVECFRKELSVIRSLSKVRVVRFSEFGTSKEELDQLRSKTVM